MQVFDILPEHKPHLQTCKSLTHYQNTSHTYWHASLRHITRTQATFTDKQVLDTLPEHKPHLLTYKSLTYYQKTKKNEPSRDTWQTWYNVFLQVICVKDKITTRTIFFKPNSIANWASMSKFINFEVIVKIFMSWFVVNTFNYHIFAPMGRFQLELIYLLFSTVVPSNIHIMGQRWKIKGKLILT